jgi:NADH:ubiquinone oxidoreductase subunit 4 (subunit M)
LAGLLLKLGGYGLLIIFYVFLRFYSFYLFFFCFVGSFIRRVICSLQRDGKVLIAYSSITHINFRFFVIFFFFSEVKILNFFIILSHGVVASLIFWRFGLVYYLSFTRNLFFLKGMQNSFFFLMFTIYLVNFGLPPFTRFIQELFLFFSIFVYRFFFIFFFFVYFVFIMYYNIFFCLFFFFKKKNFYY